MAYMLIALAVSKKCHTFAPISVLEKHSLQNPI